MAIIQGNAKQGSTRGFYPKVINGSLRFNDDDSAYLTWTPASAGNRKTWTWSGWVKLSKTSFNNFLECVGPTTPSTRTSFMINDLNKLDFFTDNTSSSRLTTTQVFRDFSAWYHIVLAVDTTQATASNRVKVYLNGSQITTFDTASYPSQNLDTQINNTQLHTTGRVYDPFYANMYLAEVHFTDGTAYDADAFGELKSGIWIPKSPSVTYGTNGFYLDFADSAAVGDDESGEGNDWTPNNFTASDVVLDSPTDNFCTWNPLDLTHERDTLGALSWADGNLYASTTEGQDGTKGTIHIPTDQDGKYYFEITWTSGSNDLTAGIGSPADTASTGALTGKGGAGLAAVIAKNGDMLYNNAVNSGWAPTIGVGDVVGVAVDCSAGNTYFSKNGQWLDGSGGTTTFGSAANATTSGLADTITPLATMGDNSAQTANFGQQDFTYTPPSGYVGISTSNLPEPTISPANDASPEDHFNVIAYSGSGSQSVTGVGFQPDFVWVKGRSFGYNHQLHDVVRGATAGALFSNSTVAEQTAYQFDSFDSDGFTTDSANITGINNTGQTFVAWNWKANGSGVSNTAGSITSTVSANTDAGFSIVSYTGNGTAGATVGHGLSSAPEMVFTKERGSSGSWPVYHVGVSSAPETDYFFLNATDQVEDNILFWNDTAPSSSVVTIGSHPNVNRNTENIIMYCFHSVDGFSKVGYYLGNGNADGPFIYTGFRPKMVIWKRTSGAGQSWEILDTERDPYNGVTHYLYPDTSGAENNATAYPQDFLSNGFKIRHTGASANLSGSNYIYIAFAEQPAKYSNAR